MEIAATFSGGARSSLLSKRKCLIWPRWWRNSSVLSSKWKVAWEKHQRVKFQWQ